MVMDYENTYSRQALFENIRMELSLQDTPEVTKIIKKLRSTYNHELLKTEKSKKGGRWHWWDP